MKNRLEDGCDLDVDHYIEHHIDTLHGRAGEPRLFRDLVPSSRDVTTALLLDGSSSLGQQRRHVPARARVRGRPVPRAGAGARAARPVRVQRQHAPPRGRAPACATSATPTRSCRARSALTTGGYTRLGAPLRHLTRRLLDQEAERRLLIVIGDGMISDDGYEGHYAWADSAHAVEEAGEAGVTVFYLGVGEARVDPLPAVFGPRRSTRIKRVERASRVLARVHRELVAA
jgi:nitric oxide reductase activation protein